MNLAIISTDWHLQSKNLEQIIELSEQEILEAEKLGISQHIWLGDIFESRISQRQDVLNALTKIIEMYDEANHQIICIPGNHDKTDYNSKSSFLDAYKYHPSFDLIDDLDCRQIKGVNCFFLPFFNEKILVENLEGISERGELLFGHFAISGSTNNNGTKVSNSLKSSMFKNFSQVFLGHYHNYQEVTSNIIHLGSLTQNNFGEDEDKGFWLLSQEGGEFLFDLIPSKGIGYKKIEINLDEVDFQEADKLIKKFRADNSGSRIRVELKGEDSVVQSFDGHLYQELGIDVKKKPFNIEGEDAEERMSEIRSMTPEDLQKKFEVFCKENDYNYKEGIEILKEILYDDKCG